MPSHRRESFDIFEIVRIEMAFVFTLNVIIRRRLCEVAYTNPLVPPFSVFFFNSNQRGGGGGAWALVPLGMPVTIVQPGLVNLWPKRGSEETEHGEGVGGGFPRALPR